MNRNIYLSLITINSLILTVNRLTLLDRSIILIVILRQHCHTLRAEARAKITL